MFLSMSLVLLFILYFFLWGDYMKILIYLEVVSLCLIFLLVYYISYDYFSLNYFFSCLIFLVCESSMGFLLFILYISMESDVVKKMNLVQF